ncbi:phosphatase PAP2 family protein [Actinomycetospora sp. TBRC 11914]|uniref:phosphatase PAP2 family protein n=1 Tax=Actinomycetospora sp. TBRC 11914 TaxID=2729387 RepID=UPI00145F5B18|nr:phosphatase PAP2 family protein [Actinomycetospora sp. TBRC 11914]NMO90298.1 phosphatase PAP2 family protein [Actinomycetospora sp. TBRC 11914]
MLRARRRRDRSDERQEALCPPWALRVAVAASLAVVLLAEVVWRTRQPDPADADLMYWQEVAKVRADGVATAVATAVGPLVVLAAVVGVAVAGRARRWDAALLALVAVPGTLAVELVVKEVVHRQRPGGDDLLFPSGHVAVATAAAVTVVLVLRSTAVAARTRRRVALGAGLSVVVVAVARLVQTVHYATDVVGGVALGLATTCWAAVALTAAAGPGRARASRGGGRAAP